ARGLEFDTVIMPLLDENLVPNQREIEVLGREEAAARESNLLYVGITRAKANLVLMHSSSLTSLLPSPSSGLFTEVSGAAP
ncbi:3'-5' exonuclease, partial [Frankia sp. CpI1-P]